MTMPPGPFCLGITGTRQGFSHAQAEHFTDFVCECPQILEFHFGLCVGVDMEAFWMGVELGSLGVPHAWPAEVAPRWRGSLTPEEVKTLGVVMHDRRPPLVRNRIIVHRTDTLLSYPTAYAFNNRSGGTMHATGEAIVKRHHTIVVLPDGKIIETWPPST